MSFAQSLARRIFSDLSDEERSDSDEENSEEEEAALIDNAIDDLANPPTIAQEAEQALDAIVEPPVVEVEEEEEVPEFDFPDGNFIEEDALELLPIMTDPAPQLRAKAIIENHDRFGHRPYTQREIRFLRETLANSEPFVQHLMERVATQRDQESLDQLNGALELIMPLRRTVADFRAQRAWNAPRAHRRRRPYHPL